jgi:thioredoxin 1
MAEEFTLESYESKVANAKGYAVVDFHAPWCGPCVAFGPTFTAVADEMQSKATFGKVNVDQNGAIAQKLGIMSIPTLVVFKDGKEVKRTTGAMSKADFVDMLNKALI